MISNQDSDFEIEPLYNVLEGTFELVLANAQHIRAWPGRKTDVGDAEWIADLLQHGFIRGSFIPTKPMRELRELTRYRKALIQERCSEINRVQKVLEGANIKLASVATNIMGVSGRAILEALVAGRTDAQTLAELAHGSMRKKMALLHQALTGHMGAHQRFVLAQQLAHIDTLDDTIAQCSSEIAERMQPFEAQLERLCTIPGVGRRIAETLLAEIGVDMTRFPTAKHLASWAGVCPGNYESAGKRKSGKTRGVPITEVDYLAGARLRSITLIGFDNVLHHG
jgi:transposase